MATLPATTGDGELWSGLATEGKIPASLRKEGIDEGARLTYLTRKWSSFTWMLHKNFQKSQTVVGDRKYLAREIDELDRFYTVQIGSNTPTNHSQIALTNSQAIQLQPADTLYIRDLYAVPIGTMLVRGQVVPAANGIQGANIGPDFLDQTGVNVNNILFSRKKGPDVNGTYFVDVEQIRVKAIGDPNSAGSGLTWVTVERCYFGPGAHDQGGAIINRQIVNNAIGANVSTGDSSAALVAGDVLLRGAPSFLEGTQYPNGIYKNPTVDNNFTQLYKYAVEKTKESDIPETWINERPFDINKWVTLLRMNRDREYQNLLGRKGMGRDVDGKEIYMSGGVREFIPKDADHYLIYPSATITWPGLLDMQVPLLNLCNSGEMLGITGPSLMIGFQKSFWNEHLWYNKEESKAFNMEVNTLMLGGIKINLIVSQIFEEAHYGNELMLLDMAEGNSFEPVTNKGWDYIVEKGLAAPGSNLVKEGIQGMFGLRRRRRNHHAIIDFSNAITIR